MARKERKIGRLITNDVRLYEHERVTVDYFLMRGEDIELLPLKNMVGEKNADFMMRGIAWEAKSPTSNNCKTLIVTMRRASKQSTNVIIDLRRVKGSDAKMRHELENSLAKLRR